MKLFVRFIGSGTNFVFQPLLILILTFSLAYAPNLIGQENEKLESASAIDGFDQESAEQLQMLIRKNAFSKNPAISIQAFHLLILEPKFHQNLGEGVQMELVKHGLKRAETQNAAFSILSSSKVSGAERQDLVLEAYSIEKHATSPSESAWLEIERSSSEYVDRLVHEIELDPSADHTIALRLFERLGKDAAKATPVLLKMYEARLEKARQNKKPAEYLDILFAICETGPQTKEGMKVILAACAENANSEERKMYPLVGLKCIEFIKSPPKPQFMTDVSKYGKYAKSLFESYDKDKDGFLNPAELKLMRRPPANADSNRDGLISHEEMVFSLAGGKARVRMPTSIRKAVEINAR